MKKLKIVADENIPFVEAFFECFGEIQCYPGRSLSSEQLKEADILLIRSVTKVDEVLLRGTQVKFVGTCTIGIDHLDTKYLESNGISYDNAPGCNADGVVQYDLAALAALDTTWQNKTVGVIGGGNVGGRLIKALMALGVNCCIYDPFLVEGQMPFLTGFDDVLACDIICMHAPYTVSGPFPTHHMINKQALNKIRPGAILLNAGRGGAIDNQALLSHMQEGANLNIILDVWENEPEISVALMKYVKIASSHIAGYGYEGKLNGSAMIFSSLLKFLDSSTGLAEGKTKSDYLLYCNELLKQLKGEPEFVDASSVSSAVSASYDVWADDARFRQAMNTAVDSGGSVSGAFDRLRKTYPTRRELSHFKVNSSDNNLQRSLLGLGFVNAS